MTVNQEMSAILEGDILALIKCQGGVARFAKPAWSGARRADRAPRGPIAL
jgi:hypothetical protein